MKRRIYALIVILTTLAGCNVAKRLPKGEKLFDGSEINIKADSTIAKKEADGLKDQLLELARPKRNAQLFGFPYKVWLYYVIGEPRKERGLRASLRRRFGEEPVLASAKALSSNATIFIGYLENEGYFRSAAAGRLVENGYKAKAVYDVTVRPRYYIDSVAFLIDSTPARKALRAVSPTTLLKKGDPYRFAVIQAEQERINGALKQRGFYYFQPDYVAVLADSAVGNHRVRLYLAIKPDAPQAAQVPYFIRRVYIYPNYTLTGSLLSEAVNDTNRREAYTPTGLVGQQLGMRRFFIVDSARLYKPELFRDVVMLRAGRRYNSRAQDLTLSRFINLGVFKFVRNRFVPATEGDSAVLDVHYYLTPFPKKSIRAEVAGTSKSNSLVGSEVTVGWRNRNTFRRAELLTVDLSGGVEFQVGSFAQNVTNFRLAATTQLSIPRLITPGFRIRYDRRQILPKTNISLGYEYIARQSLYNLEAFNTAFGYSWRTNPKTEFTFQPFNVIYAVSSNFGPRFIEGLLNPFTERLFERLLDDQFILGTTYSVNYNSSPLGDGRNSYRIGFTIEGAGNVAGLLFPRLNAQGYKTLFGQIFQQYGRADVDARYYVKPTARLTWANRFQAGVGIPYGNSGTLPFIKQFFAGGPNSLRGFRPRTVGPGNVFLGGNEDAPFFQDGGGDIKLEANTEIRAKLTSIFQGALFVDAGNVWLFRDRSVYENAQAVFSRNFLRQTVVSMGFGLRVDLSFFLIRADLGIPVRKPWRPEGQRWVFDEFDLANPIWRRNNLILNIAVGYPF